MTINVTDAQHAGNLKANATTGVKCEIDGVYVHRIDFYLARVHPAVSLEEYQMEFPDAEIISPAIKKQREERAAKEQGLNVNVQTVVDFPAPKSKSFAEVFEMSDAKGAKNKRGEPIMIDVLAPGMQEYRHFVPEIDPNYLFDIDLTKKIMMATVMNMPLYCWGMHGTGKTTAVLQFCARTNRQAMRVQHTGTTEEAHILGQYTVRGGDTIFEPGPLAIAMRYGLVYIADEYDFAMPSAVAVYQPVLEGHPLLIKEAPPEWRYTKPHPNFRFFATGNTNGSGDETGLYQGTQMQNAANFSRFGITVEAKYMSEKAEAGVVSKQSKVHIDDSAKIVEFAGLVRQSYQRGDIGMPISTRELIGAAKMGRALGGEWKQGIEMAYTARLNVVDREAVEQIVQRIFAA